MVKETKHHKDERKKPTMSLKERRAKKHEKKQQKLQKLHNIEEQQNIA
ncbi:MAG: hypothetical protein JSR46_12080 [Verrucomicrobia bacterium]|nr:hypothetical protein [Verrucomicrobiota bacterium]